MSIAFEAQENRSIHWKREEEKDEKRKARKGLVDPCCSITTLTAILLLVFQDKHLQTVILVDQFGQPLEDVTYCSSVNKHA